VDKVQKTVLTILGVILFLAFVLYGMPALEIIHRARAAYLRGEDEFAKKLYKQAMWDYQEVQEFYYLPHTSYVDKAEEKEWVCRAYLGDWIPVEGPMDADLRKLHPEVYQKYRAELDAITPVGDSTFQPAPMTPPEKEYFEKEMKKAQKKSGPLRN
jgi:hypothetical protein